MKYVSLFLAGIAAIVILSIILFGGSNNRSRNAPPQPPDIGHIEKPLDPELRTIAPETDVMESDPASGTINEPVPDADSSPEDSFTPVEGGQGEEDDYDGEEDDFGC